MQVAKKSLARCGLLRTDIHNKQPAKRELLPLVSTGMTLRTARNYDALLDRLIALEDEACRYQQIALNTPTDCPSAWSLIRDACSHRVEHLRQQIVILAQQSGVQLSARP